MSRRIVRLAAVIAGLAVMSTACATKTIDSGSVEKQVVAQLKTEFPSVERATAACPNDVKVKKGEKFTCVTTLDGSRADLRVEILAVKGKRFEFRPKAVQPLYETAALERRVKEEASARDVDCGPRTVLVKRKGDTISCTATLTDGTVRILRLRVANTAGQLEPVP